MVSDHKNKRDDFESVRSPNVCWVDLPDMDFAPGQPAKKLTLIGGAIFVANAAAREIAQVLPPLGRFDDGRELYVGSLRPRNLSVPSYRSLQTIGRT